jgi:hypothetical protein
MLRSGRARLAIASVFGLIACTQDVDPPWQLDHDRVIAVRFTPPRILTGEIAELAALLGRKGQPPSEVDPDTVEVDSPTSLSSTLGRTSSQWTVTAPGSAQLAAARSELGLAADAPVPLRVRVKFAATGLTAFKVVWLGEHADNPSIDPVTIDGMNGLLVTYLAVTAGVDIPLSVTFDDRYNINWLTSCGTMHDFDLARAYLRVEPEDPQSGSLAIVVRDELGGVSWRIWPITTR